MRTIHSLLRATVLGGILLLLGTPVGAVTSKASLSRAVQVFSTIGTNGKGTVVVSGAIADHGTSSSLASNYTITKIVLQHGTIEVNTSKLEQAETPSVNSTTCSYTYSGTAEVSIVSGTGSYNGIKGTLKATAAGAGILTKLKSGKCQESESSEPIFSIGTVQSSGTVTVS
jgi:hypothetical protein